MDRRALIIGHDTDPAPGEEEVTHRVLDLERVVIHPFIGLQDEAVMSGNLLSESAGLPPAGAWTLL